MKLIIEQRRWFLLILPGLTFLACGILPGCADGPLPYMNSMNPMTRSQWEADEQYQPTLHRQIAEVHAVRDAASTMPNERQVHWSHELAYLLQKSDNSLLRQAAVEALAGFTVPQASEGLRIADKDGDPSVRMAACRAWGKQAGDESVERLAEMLGSDTSLDVRLAAARELGRFSDATSLAALGLALDDRDPAMQHRVIESLRASSGRDYGNDLAAWRQFAQGTDPRPQATESIAERFRHWF